MKLHKQETPYTCGGAAMKMVLDSLGIKKTEKQLTKLLKTNKIRGTWHRFFPQVAEKYKLNYIVERNSSINRLKTLLKKGYKIIVCYYYPPEKVDHYSVIKKIRSKIYFYDPFFGKNHSYSLTYFNKIWKSDPKYDNEKNWFIAIRL